MAIFGKLLPETVNRRSFNPELKFIDEVHNCVLSQKLLIELSDIKRRSDINKTLSAEIRLCFSKGYISTKSTYSGIDSKLTVFTNKNQSDVSYDFGKHEYIVNTYRYSSWKKKYKNMKNKNKLK